MSRKPDWTLDEFRTLARNATLRDAELAQLLPERSADAVAVVRQGIHAWHRGQRETTLLSRLMKTWLEERSETIKCAVCLAQLELSR